MNSLKLDFKDRIILANQYRILERLDPGEAASYRRAVEILESGFESEYESIDTAVNYDSVPEHVCEEVHAILEMSRCLSRSYAALPDKTGIDPDHVKFRGFDGHESNHLSYAKFLSSHSKYEESKVFDSHEQRLDMYRRMLAEFKRVRAGKQECLLDKAAIQSIVDARIYRSPG